MFSSHSCILLAAPLFHKLISNIRQSIHFHFLNWQFLKATDIASFNPCSTLIYIYDDSTVLATQSLFILWSIYTPLACLLAHFPLTDSVFFIKREGQKIRKLSSKSARIAIDWITLAFNINAYLHTIIEISLFVKLTYPLSSTTYQILVAKFDYSHLFYHQCNKSLVSLLLWFWFIFCPWCPSYE